MFYEIGGTGGGGANILMLLLTKNEMRFKYDNL